MTGRVAYYEAADADPTDYTPSGGVDGDVAGYHVGVAGVVCVECYDVTAEYATFGDTLISTFSEWQSPGVECDECGRYLDTWLLRE